MEPLVSVLCLAYNHEAYIRQTLDSFLAQETDFPFEIIIHDDASTDRTAEIIREYEAKYPGLIRPIYQTENQYSRGVKISRVWNLPRTQGKYIAFCEGDDCWTSPYKLQTQYNYMERNPDCGVCVHQAVRNSLSTKKKRLQTPETAERDFSLEEVIRLFGSLFATNTTFVRKEHYEAMPECFLRQKDVGDIPQRLAAVRRVISWLRKRRTTSPKQGGGSSAGRPNFTPRAFAAAMPSRWRVLMCSRSVSATKDRICNTRSAMNMARSPCRVVVSRIGMSRTRTCTWRIFTSRRHSSCISA